MDEKIYLTDHRGLTASDIAAVMSNRERERDSDLLPAMMMGGGFGANQWMNNPFAYMMMMAWMRDFNRDRNGHHDSNDFVEVQSQLNAIRTQLSDNQNIQLLRQAIGDGFQRNEFALSQLAQNLNVDFNTLQRCCCEVQAAIQQVAGQVGFSAERVINAANMGDCRIIETLKDCCCQNKELVQRMGYENQLGQKDIQYTTERGFCGLGREIQFGFDRTNTGIERAAAAQAYANQQQTCDIIKNQELNTQRIIDTLNNHWKDEQALQIQDLKFQLSQERQNRLFLSRRGCDGCGCNNGCGCDNGF